MVSHVTKLTYRTEGSIVQEVHKFLLQDHIEAVYSLSTYIFKSMKQYTYYNGTATCITCNDVKQEHMQGSDLQLLIINKHTYPEFMHTQLAIVNCGT